MIAIDTNVLLRYLLGDDQEQAAKLINGTEPVLITDVVLTESIWTLKGSKYKLGKDEITRVINALFKEPNLYFEDGQTVWRALHDYRKAQPIKSGGRKKQADFPDALILNKAKFQASEGQQAFKGLYSFDIAAQVIDGVEKP